MEPLAENATLLSQLEKHAGTNPDKAAYIFVDKDLGERVITRQEIWDLTRKCAAIFKRLGLGKGDVICNTLGNSPERLISQFGSIACGATPSQGQLFLADGADLLHNLRESKSKAIIYDPNITNGAGYILESIKYQDGTAGAVKYKDLPHLTQVIEIRALGVEEPQRWLNTIARESEMFLDKSVTNSDIALVFVTSGTTGFSKLVPQSHKNVLRSLHDMLDLTGYDRRYENRPYFNIQSVGWAVGSANFYPSSGCTRLLLDLTNGLPENMLMGAFLFKVCNRFRPNMGFMAIRDIQHMLAAYRDGHRLDEPFESILTGAGPVYSPTMEALGKITKKIVVGYGGTEFLLASGLEVTQKSHFMDTCVGRARKSVGAEIRVVEMLHQEDLPAGRNGEILIRSEVVFKGYMNDAAKTAETFTQEGWYKTGDVGYLDQQGRLFVEGRRDDVINRDGIIHYPGWMERRINKHHAIENCIVLGIPDPNRNQEICLCYKTVAGCDVSADDVREHCKKLFLTGENDRLTPLPAHYLEFDDLITNHHGKLDRKKMRQEVLKRFDICQ